MRQYIIRRIGYSVLSLFLLSLTIFLFVRLTGDPATLLVEPGASEAEISPLLSAKQRGYLSFWWDGAALEWRAHDPDAVLQLGVS